MLPVINCEVPGTIQLMQWGLVHLWGKDEPAVSKDNKCLHL
jgi:hypothetical protein